MEGNSLDTDASDPSSTPEEEKPLKRVTIFGFSANPPTGDSGHGGIVKYLISTGEYDEVWLLPVYKHIFTSKSNLESFEHRFAMCQLFAERLSTPQVKVKVQDFERVVYNSCSASRTGLERRMSRDGVAEMRVGTIDIIHHIHRNHQDVSLISINLGQDTFHDLKAGLWKCSEEIMSLVEVNVFRRSAAGNCSREESLESLACFPQAKKITHILVPGLGQTSSTSIRSSTLPVSVFSSYKQVVAAHRRSLPLYEEIYDYIMTNRLYFFSPETSQYLRWRYWLQDGLTSRPSPSSSSP